MPAETRPGRGLLHRLAANGAYWLVPALAAWAALSVQLALTKRGAPMLALVFLAGVVGVICWLGVAALSLACAIGRWEPHTAPPPWQLSRFVAPPLCALAVAALASLSASHVADWIVPASVDVRPVVVAAAGHAIALSLAAVGALVTRPRDPPWWVFGLLLLALRHLLARDAAVLVAGRELWLDLGSAAALLLLFARLGRYRQRRPATIAAGAGATILVATVAVLLLQLGPRWEARSALEYLYPGPGRMVHAMRLLFDADGDGHAAIFGGADCDDSDPSVHPAATEVVGNGVDDNCMGGDLAALAAPTPVARHGDRAASVILITIDAWRSDTLVGDGRLKRIAMPHLARFAAGAAVFPRTFASAPYTELALLSLVSGTLPMDFFAGHPAFLGYPKSIAERLAAVGYATSCLSQIYLLNPYIVMGCQHFDETLAPQNIAFNGRTSREMTDRAIAEVERLRAAPRPFFLWAHYFDPHTNYLYAEGAPFPFDSVRNRYLHEIWYTDREVGRLLGHVERAGLLERAVVVITGDHGELLGEDGRVGHAFWVEELTLEVPIILRAPGARPGIYSTRVRSIDLYPTLLDVAAGVEAPSDGRHLAPVWSGRETADRDVFAMNRYHGMDLRAAIVGRWTLIYDGTTGGQLLTERGAPRLNRVESAPAQARRMRRALGHRWDLSINDVVIKRKLAERHQRLIPEEKIAERRLLALRRNCCAGQRDACRQLELLERR